MLPTPTSPVAFTPQTIMNNKENVIVHPLKNVNGNGRRTRSRPTNTPSPVCIAREVVRDPRRRRTLSPPLIAQKRAMHVTVDDDMEVDVGALSSPAATPAVQRTLQLPRHLKRPIFKEISVDALQAVDPTLKDVALKYIQTQLESAGAQLLAAANSTTANPPRDHLPRELEVLVHDMSAPLPTHAFAICSKSSSRVSLHPAHALVLAANCAHLPPLPPSKAVSHSKLDSETSTAATSLPVVPLRLPHSASFSTLLHYLYTKRVDYLFAFLLPPTSGTLQSLEQLSQHLAATFTLQALLTHAARVHGLWSNVVALGVFDDTLWKTMEMCWEALLGALAKSTGAQWQTVQKL